MKSAHRKTESPWLLLAFSLPSKRASQRVEVWRKLQSIRKRTVYTRRSKKWMGKQWRDWRCTKRT